jgi:hypothetical protein
MTTRIVVRLCSNLILAALFAQLAGPALAVARRTPARDDADARGSLAESQLAARRSASTRSPDLDLEPSISREAARPTAPQCDLAVVPFKMMVNKNKGGMVYDRTRAYFVDHMFKVAPKPQVESAIKEMGLLSNEAIQLPDADAICRAMPCRYLAFGTVKLPKADTGFSPVGGAVASASTLLGGVGGLAAASALPFAAGVLAVSAVGGFTTASTVDIECRIYDNKVQKIIWVGTETFTAKKHLMAVFADKKQLQEQALSAALKKLFDPIVHKLQPAKARAQVD